MSSCAPVVVPQPVPDRPDPLTRVVRDDLPLESLFQNAREAIHTLKYDEAQQFMASLLESPVFETTSDSSLKFQFVELYARLLAERDIDRALDLVSSYQYLDSELIVPVNLLRWDLCVQGAHFLKAISILKEMGNRRFLKKQEANGLIWQTLFIYGGAYGIDWEQIDDPNLVAWGELARLHQSHFSSESMLTALESWQRKHPSHAVTADPPVSFSLFSNEVVYDKRIRNVAVVLPTQGSLGKAASAIRDGFLFAYMEDVSSSQKRSSIDVSFYDTDQQNPTELVRNTFAQGADLTVGFIDKDLVSQVLDHGPFSRPVVLLNRVNYPVDTNNNQVLQFSLSIDDEIDAIVSKLESRGHRRIVLFSGTQPWSIRARNRFLVNFENERQSVVAQEVFVEPTEIIDVVGQGLDISVSQNRRAELERLTRSTYEFIPRRRLDVDAIVAFVDQSAFKSMLAALNYHYASEVPLFVTETAVRAVSTSEFESPVHFTATPWLVEDTPVKKQIANLFKPPNGTESLYAFGIDIYRIASNWQYFNKLGWLIGSSGTFQLKPNGAIVRTPVWGEMNNRVFQVVKGNTISHTETSNLNLPIVLR